MRKLYLDMTENQGCTSYFMKDTEIIQAGATVYSMPVSARNEEYQRLADEYDLQFIFDDMNVKVDFYTVPRVDIMAVDSRDGYIATVGALSDPEGDAPVCYIDRDKNVYLIARNMRSLMEDIGNWRRNLKPYEGIRFFQSKEEAARTYEFLDGQLVDAEERANAKARERWNAIHSNYEREQIQYDDWLETFEEAIDSCQTPVIDLGCGSGNDTLYLIEHGKRVISCDYAPNVLRNIRKNFPEVEKAMCFDMTKGLPFESDFTDLIVCDLSLHYFTEQKTFEILDEIKRVLRPDGLLLFRVNSVHDFNHGAGKGREVEPHLYETGDGRYKRFFDAGDIERFWGGWDTVYLREERMDRYELEKILWKGAMRLKCDIKLVEPAMAYAGDIWQFRQEIMDSDDRDKFAGCGNLESCASAGEWIDTIRRQQHVETCPEDKVPSNIYLAVRERDNRIVGVIDLRHHINHPILGTWGGHMGYYVRPSERNKGYAKEMVRQNLQYCRALGIHKVMITCDEDNLASEKVITANGGIYEKSIVVDGCPVRRFWIDLADNK